MYLESLNMIEILKNIVRKKGKTRNIILIVRKQMGNQRKVSCLKIRYGLIFQKGIENKVYAVGLDNLRANTEELD